MIMAKESLHEYPVAAADGGRDIGLEEFLVVQRGRRG
jgi:hypothetical protein